MSRQWQIGWVLVLAATLQAPRPCQASNQDSVFLGNLAALTGGSVTATIRDGEAAWYNPAGLGGVELNSVDVSASAFQLRVRQISSLVETILPDGSALSLDVDSTKLLSIPSALVYTRQLGDDTWAALGLFVPRQDEFTLSELQEGEGLLATAAGVVNYSFRQRALVESSERLLLVGPSVGSELADGVRIGGSVFIAYGTVQQTFQTWQEISIDAGQGLSTAFGLEDERLDLSYLGLQGVVGLQYAPLPWLTLGLTVRTPVFRVVQWGEVSALSQASGAGPLFVPGSDLEPYNLAQFAENNFTDWGFDAILPGRIHLASAFQIGQAWLSLEFDLSHPLDATDVTPKYDWTWNIRAGAFVPLTHTVALGLGFFTDRSQNELLRRSAASGEHINYYGGTVGVQFEKSYNVTDEEEGDELTFSTTIAVRYAAGIGQTAGVTIFPLEQINDLNRRIGVTYQEVGLHLGSGLYF